MLKILFSAFIYNNNLINFFYPLLTCFLSLVPTALVKQVLLLCLPDVCFRVWVFGAACGTVCILRKCCQLSAKKLGIAEFEFGSELFLAGPTHIFWRISTRALSTRYKPQICHFPTHIHTPESTRISIMSAMKMRSIFVYSRGCACVCKVMWCVCQTTGKKT